MTEESQDEQLATRTLGEAGPHVVFVHGLFGQGRNWTSIAKGLAGDHRVTLIDLPNHGHSPWTDRVDYLDMARLVADELASFGEPVTLVGHSMGGKVAMTLALRRPELLRALVVVDIAPVEYPVAGSRTDDPVRSACPNRSTSPRFANTSAGSCSSTTRTSASMVNTSGAWFVTGSRGSGARISHSTNSTAKSRPAPNSPSIVAEPQA